MLCPSMPRRIAVVALILALSACGRDPAPGFTFVPLAGMSCADGSATGVGYMPGSDDVLVFLDGGGACWAPGACDPASVSPFGAADLAAAEDARLPGTILDPSVPGNPFADFTMVFVPYCTGDVHAGDRDRVDGSTTWHHHGEKNLEAVVEWMATALPRPSRVVVAGSSAGGFGALVAHRVVRARWPEATYPDLGVALVDDSGPTFVGSAIPDALRTAWWDAWNLASTVAPACPECQADLSALFTHASAEHPGDRLALLSTTADDTMRMFLGGMTGLEFEGALAALAGKLEALPAANARTFRVAGTDHALLAAPTTYSAGGTTLLDWLGPLATGTGPFSSAGP
jgi:hypothetical protein